MKGFNVLLRGLAGLMVVVAVIVLAYRGDSNTPKIAPTATMSVADRARALVKTVVASDNIEVSVNAVPAVVVSFPMLEDLQGYNLKNTEAQMVDVACALRGEFGGYRYLLNAEIELVDAGTQHGLSVLLMPEAIAGLDCEADIDLQTVADTYDLNALLK